jgi:hypothetical protein
MGVEGDFRTQTFVPNSVVTIIVERDEITGETWLDTLEGILTHEFTHFYQDAEGRFLRDSYFDGVPGNSVQDFDDGAFDNLFGTPADAEMDGLRDAFEKQRLPQPDGPGEPDTRNNGWLIDHELLLYQQTPAGDHDWTGIVYV